MEAACQNKNTRESPVFSACITRALVVRLDEAGTFQNGRRESHDVTGDGLPRRRRYKVKTSARTAGPFLDDVHKPAQSALRILFRKPGDIRINGLLDLLTDETVHVPADTADRNPGTNRGNRQIGER